MSAVKPDAVQLGTNVDATKNFTLRHNNDGSGGLYRGNVGATTQDILTWDAAGRIAMPQNATAFKATLAGAVGIAVSSWVKVPLNAEAFDLGGFFDAVTNYRFQPTIPGYYQLNGGVGVPSGSTVLIAALYVNGGVSLSGTDIRPETAVIYSSQVGGLVYLNGTTDYVELFAYNSSGTITGDNTQTYLTGHLVARA